MLQKGNVFFNQKSKIYPSGIERITVCSEAIFKDKSIVEIKKPKPGGTVYNEAGIVVKLAEPKASKPKNMDNETRNDSTRRAKERVHDIAALNDFTHFITWTLDKDIIDRYNPKVVGKKLRQFLNDKMKRNNLMYLVIGEPHKDGAIHMHGLIKGDVELKDSGKKTRDRKTIYNMPQWKYGWSTAIDITGDRGNLAKYITKYMSKSFKKIFGDFYYAGGKGLKRSPPVRLYNTDYQKVNAKEYHIENAGLSFKYLTNPAGSKA
jgi:hypothetical protein